MKLTEITCHECGFDKWEIEFEPVFRVASKRCPNCQVNHVAIVNFKPQMEYEEER